MKTLNLTALQIEFYFKFLELNRWTDRYSSSLRLRMPSPPIGTPKMRFEPYDDMSFVSYSMCKALIEKGLLESREPYDAYDRRTYKAVINNDLAEKIKAELDEAQKERFIMLIDKAFGISKLDNDKYDTYRNRIQHLENQLSLYTDGHCTGELYVVYYKKKDGTFWEIQLYANDPEHLRSIFDDTAIFPDAISITNVKKANGQNVYTTNNEPLHLIERLHRRIKQLEKDNDIYFLDIENYKNSYQKISDKFDEFAEVHRELIENHHAEKQAYLKLVTGLQQQLDVMEASRDAYAMHYSELKEQINK